MSNKVKVINIKNKTYYFFDDIINTKYFDPNNIKIDEKSYKNQRLIKDSKYVKINCVNLLYLIFNKVNGYFEEINVNEYLTLVPTNEKNKTKKQKKI